jgi:hypothetical protein
MEGGVLRGWITFFRIDEDMRDRMVKMESFLKYKATLTSQQGESRQICVSV